MSRRQGRSPTSGEIEEWHRFAGSGERRTGSAPARKKAVRATTTAAEAAKPPEKARPEGGGRAPTDEELREWAMLTGTAVPAPAASPAKPASSAPPTARPTSKPPPKPRIKAFELGSKAPPERAVSFGARDAASTRESAGNIDRKVERRLKSGKLDPERVIDLHGLDRKQAELTLFRFLQGCRAGKVRLALVVTGKGLHAPADWLVEEPGVLRRSVPVWLQRKPLSDIVQHFSPAHPSHGGGGAYYVYLRQARNR